MTKQQAIWRHNSAGTWCPDSFCPDCGRKGVFRDWDDCNGGWYFHCIECNGPLASKLVKADPVDPMMHDLEERVFAQIFKHQDEEIGMVLNLLANDGKISDG